eukprot:TRINITY_DN34676_c0_g1_i1.p1 TRINITY_DN34676_c0_g1~~TRINITY_DN34676_c0_g1_i1.p1  ORF type:complete len:622 (-),score=119.09 TRINITY_DN34676_c0_g1_i1:86-1951(-)
MSTAGKPRGAGQAKTQQETSERTMTERLAKLRADLKRVDQAVLRKAGAKMLQSRTFDGFIGIVIVTNALTIGLEQSLDLQGNDTSKVEVVENFFLVIYMFELGLRIFSIGSTCFREHWVKFDAFLILTGCLTNWIIAPFFQDEGGDKLGPLLVLRTARLLRLAKMARFLNRFEQFWGMVRAIMASTCVVGYSLVLLFISCYICSSIGIEVIAKHALSRGPAADAGFQELVNDYFSSLPKAMLTLLQFATLDNPSTIYRKFVEYDPWLSLYFLFVTVVMGVVVMNLILAVIVTRSLEQNMEDKNAAKNAQDLRLRTLVGELKQMLVKQDDGESGKVSRGEISKISQKVDQQDMAMLCQSMRVTGLTEIFETLNVEKSNKIPIQEFCDGIWQDLTSKSPLQLKRMQKQVEAIHFRLKSDSAIEQAMQDVISELTTLKDKLCNSSGAYSPPPSVSSSGLHDFGDKPSKHLPAVAAVEDGMPRPPSPRKVASAKASLDKGPQHKRNSLSRPVWAKDIAKEIAAELRGLLSERGSASNISTPRANGNMIHDGSRFSSSTQDSGGLASRKAVNLPQELAKQKLSLASGSMPVADEDIESGSCSARSRTLELERNVDKSNMTFTRSRT